MKRYFLSQGVEKNQIENQMIVFSQNEDELYYLNSTAAFILSLITSDGVSEEEILQCLIDRFDVSVSECQSDLDQTLNEMLNASIIRAELCE